MDDGFGWDARKSRSNLVRHKTGFELAKEIFGGPRWEVRDGRQDYGGDRTVSLGEVEGRCLVVVHTLRGEKNQDYFGAKGHET